MKWLIWGALVVAMMGVWQVPDFDNWRFWVGTLLFSTVCMLEANWK